MGRRAIGSAGTMRTTRPAAVMAVLVLGVMFAGCDRGDGGRAADTRTFSGDGPIRVVGTTGMVGDLAARVGGPHVKVTTLMGEGVDPHLYKASPGDIRQLSDADIVFYSGLHLEGKMADILERMADRKPTHAVAEGIPADRVLRAAAGTPDPHLWFDVALWSEGLATIADALATFDPPHADEYHANATAYRAELTSLDDEVRDRLATIPDATRVLVTAHDAFHYFGRAYNIEVKAIQGISTESEAGVREINDLVDYLAQHTIPAVFIESSVSDRNIRALVEGCRARGHEVVIGGQLYSDAMGKPGTPEGTYPGMVRHNVETIVNALNPNP